MLKKVLKYNATITEKEIFLQLNQLVKDFIIRIIIINNYKEIPCKVAEQYTIAKVIQLALKGQFQRSSVNLKRLVLARYYNIRLKDLLLNKFIIKFNQILRTLKDLGITILDKVVLYRFYLKVKKRFKTQVKR